MRFKNKVVIVTGSSRGIGKATAILFAKEGAKVVVNDSLLNDEAKSVVTEIKKLGSDAIAIKCDVSDEIQVKQMVEKTIKTFGKIDILVNNAGVVFDTTFKEKTVKQWKKTLEVNLIGVFLCSKYVAEYMKKQKNGKIVNISSTNGINRFSPECMDYDASKAGVINLTYNLAKELAPTIQVNSVAPGWVETSMNKDLPQEFIDEEIKKIYLKRFAKPEDIAKIILFLSSEDANYITGSIIKVDGGYS